MIAGGSKRVSVQMSRIRLSHKFALIKRSKTHICCLAALATLGACAPLAKVREINPRLGAQHGTLPQLQRAERQSRPASS